ncbi:MAG: DUF6794 domain-containing protein [Bacteroidota bacterium]
MPEPDRFTAAYLHGIYIPQDLQDCFREIEKLWDAGQKAEAKALAEKDFVGKSHFGLGGWMRNNWQFWGGSRLSRYFNELGLKHPDDMSGLILKSYHRYLHGRPLELETEIKRYQDYWNNLPQ